MSADDTDNIRQIVALRARDSEMSWRQAIIQVVGEGSLRRLQNKLQTLEKDGKLGSLLREVLTKDHAKQYPAALYKRRDRVRFVATYPEKGVDARIEIELTSDATYSVKQAPHRCLVESGDLPDSDVYDLDLGLQRYPREPDNGYPMLCEAGLAWPAANGVIDKSSKYPPFVVKLALSLRARWASVPAFCPDLDAAGLLAAALECESRRMAKSGYAVMLSQWGDDMKMVATLLAGDVSYAFLYPEELSLCLADPRRARVLAECGCLIKTFNAVGHKVEHTTAATMDEDPWAGFRQALLGWRSNVMVDGRQTRMLQDDDARWLRDVFGGTPLVAIPFYTLRAIVKYRLSIPSSTLVPTTGSGELAEKIALVKLVSISLAKQDGVEDKYSDEDFFMRLQETFRHVPSYVRIYHVLEAFARRHRMKIQEAMWFFVEGREGLSGSLFVSVVAPAAVETQLSKRKTFEGAACWASILQSRNSAMDALVAEVVTGTGSPLDVAEAAVQWRDDGRPGQQPVAPSYGPRYDVPELSTLPDWRANYRTLAPYLGQPAASPESLMVAIEAALIQSDNYREKGFFARDEESEEFKSAQVAAEPPSDLDLRFYRRLAADPGSRRLLWVFCGILCLIVAVWVLASHSPVGALDSKTLIIR